MLANAPVKASDSFIPTAMADSSCHPSVAHVSLGEFVNCGAQAHHRLLQPLHEVDQHVRRFLQGSPPVSFCPHRQTRGDRRSCCRLRQLHRRNADYRCCALSDSIHNGQCRTASELTAPAKLGFAVNTAVDQEWREWITTLRLDDIVDILLNIFPRDTGDAPTSSSSVSALRSNFDLKSRA